MKIDNHVWRCMKADLGIILFCSLWTILMFLLSFVDFDTVWGVIFLGALPTFAIAFLIHWLICTAVAKQLEEDGYFDNDEALSSSSRQTAPRKAQATPRKGKTQNPFAKYNRKNTSRTKQQSRARRLTQEDIDLCRKFNLQQAEKAAGNLPEAYAKTLLSGKRAELMENYKLAFLRYKAVADAGYFEGMYFLVWLCCHKMNDWHQGFHWTEKALAFCPDYTSEEAHFLLSELCTIVGDRDLVDREHLLTNEERLHAEGLLAAYAPESDADVLQMLDEVEGGYNDNLNVNDNVAAHHHFHLFPEDLDREEIEDLFGNYNEYDRDISDDRRWAARGSANWTSREDWDCGNSYEDGMSGFDSYEDNDF